MAIETTPLGFKKPDGNERVRDGDNVISDNAQKAEDRFQEDRTRLSNIEAKNTAQDAAITAAQSAAQAYADTKDTANRAAWAAADAATLAGANSYTDTQVTADRIRLTTLESTTVPQALTDAKAYTDAQVAPDRVRLTNVETKNTQQDGRLAALEAVAPKVSNIALDSDGNPYYSPGSTEVHVIPDGDGEPYYITFMSASADTDGAPYF